MPVIDSSMYMVPVEKSCLVVDPCVSAEAEKLLWDMGIRDCLVLLTHEHYDHISGVNWLRKRLPCRVVCSERCAERICDAKKNAAAYFMAFAIQKSGVEQREMLELLDVRYTCQADQTYTGHTELLWRDLTLKLREVPGHSPGSQIVEIGGWWYFTGDSLIPGEMVITRLPGGSRHDYEEVTRPYLSSIAPGSVLFPGHGQETVFTGTV